MTVHFVINDADGCVYPGLTVYVDDEDADLIDEIWCAGYQNNRKDLHGIQRHERFYSATGENYRCTVLLHRLIAERMGMSRHLSVDHIDGNPANNVRSNLRQATSAQNAHNRKINSRNKSGYKGVSWKGAPHSKWEANIRTNGKQKFLGFFDDPRDAARAYDDEARTSRGEFAVVNFPKDNERGVRRESR